MNEQDPNTKQTIQAEFAEQDPNAVDVSITVKASSTSLHASKIQRAKKLAMLEESNELAKLGAKVVRTKVKMAALIGKHASSLGIKDIGHGRLLIAGDNADAAIEELDAIIQNMVDAGKSSDSKLMVDLYQLKRDFNKQIIETAEAHIDANKQVSSGSSDNKLQFPFTAGQPMTIAITNQAVGKDQEVEPKKLPP